MGTEASASVPGKPGGTLTIGMTAVNLPPLDTALTAAQGVLIPLQCETLSHRGVGQLLEHRFEAPAGGARSADFTVIVDGHAPRVLCFDGVARR